MLVKDVVSKTTQFLKDKGSESARLDSELLISAALNWDRMKIYLNYDYPLSETELTACREFVRRRAQGEPVAYILGKKDFYKSSFVVSPSVLVPRPETEILVDETAAWIRGQGLIDAKIVDLGTGSGCIGLSLLKEFPGATLFAVDLSEGAAAIANENANRLTLSERAKIRVQDANQVTAQAVVNELGGLADVVVANPPYIASNDPNVSPNVKLHEPKTALFSEEEGLAHIRNWSKVSSEILRPGAWVMFEIGHEQGPKVRQIFESTGCFEKITIMKDLAGKDRFVSAVKIGES